jgi:outer membrane receptor protein involved in Fe transport
MLKNSLLASSTLCSAASLSLLFLATPAMAQTAAAPAPAPTTADTAADAPDVVVTGSRIRRPNLDSPIPVTTVTGDQFFETGKTSIGDVLNDLPALRSTFSQSNSTRFLGTSGLNLLDLRGLGTQRTLVLVNGRRHVAGDILNTATSVDTNTIPADLIERVDVVTGGNSAIYGSDALAGVVNFVLKDHYDGFQMRGQGGISTYGDAGSYFGSALFGKNFADGRGNIAINLEYAHQQDFYASDRPYAAQTDGFIQTDSDAAGTPNGSDGIIDNTFFRDIRSGTYSNAGTFLLCCRSGGGFGIAYQPYIFNPDGTLSKQTGTITPGLTYTPSYIGGNGNNFRDGTQFAFQPKLNRYSANLIGHFEISRAFVPFIEASYTRTDSIGSASGPFFTSATGSPREAFFSDNPYLTAQARGIIRQQDSYDANCQYVSGGDGVPDADRGQCGISIYKNVVDLGQRVETARRETYRAVLGVRGDFNDNWHYEVAANYGEFREKTQILGNVNIQRYLLAIDPVLSGGQIVCRSKVDPSAAKAFEAAANTAFAAAQLANDVAQCQPINIFGSGNISQAAKNYILQNSFADGKITQFVLSGFVAGDTSKWFNLPGGPIGFSIGGEYRRETNYYIQDNFTAAGLTFYNSIPEFNPTSFEVKEAYGELRLPILRDVPFFHELTVSGAGRVANYKGSTGTVYAYNGGVEWAPIRDIRFRTNYARAVRAPNLSDLYTPLGQNFSLISDPCSAENIGSGASTRAANCHADGVPAGYNFQYTASLAYNSGGNAALKAETSNSFTVGAVLQPRFLPGFAVSVDYYNIRVNNVITAPSAQAIINACYDAASLNNQFCSLFARNAGPATGPRGEKVGRILEGSLNVVPLNYAKLQVRGIDFDVSYDRQIGRLGKFALHAIYTMALQNDSFLDPVNPGRADQTLGELGDPQHAFNIDTSFKTGPITLGYKFRYIGQMVPGVWEDTHSVQGRAPQNADRYPIQYYSPVIYHDVRVQIDVNKQYNMYVGVDNLTNKLPPYGLSGAGGGSAIYNNLGRFFYAGFVAKF